MAKGLHKKSGGHPKVINAGGKGPNPKAKPTFDFGHPPAPHAPPPSDHGAPEEEEIPNLLTPEEETCYSNRYHDLGNLTSEQHYLEIGKDEGRYYKCGDFITYYMAARYLDRYVELGDEFGRSGKSAMQLGIKHWHYNGTA
jgi:hypothetical protein